MGWPAEHAETVDHRRVRIGADQRIWIEGAAAVPHHLGQVLEIDLVNDAGGGGDNPEVVECGLAPLQEFVALVVALELQLAVDLKRHP